MSHVNRAHVNGFLFGLTLWLALLTWAWGATTYHWETIDIALSGTQETSLADINTQGDVVGTYVTPNVNGFPRQGFILSHTQIDPQAAVEQETRITILDNRALPTGINDDETVIGVSGPRCNGFLYQHGTITGLCFPVPQLSPFSATVKPTTPTSINESGQIVGTLRDVLDATHSFVWNQDHFDLFTLPWLPISMQPTGINTQGVIVGTYDDGVAMIRGFRKDGDTYTRLDAHDPCCTFPTGINDDGVIVGFTQTAPGVVETITSFVYTNGTFETVGFPGALRTLVHGINNVGQLVGEYVDTTGAGHGFLATPQPETLLPPVPPAPVPAPVPTLVMSVLGDFNGDGYQDLAGLDAQGNIWVNVTLSAGWRNIPGHLDTLVVGDFDGDGRADLAGLQTANGSIWVLTNLQYWHWIPGRLDTLVAGDFDADGIDDLAGLQTTNGSIWYTTDLLTWRWIPGFLRTLGVQPLAGGLDSLFGYQGPCWWLWAAGVWYQSSCPQTVAGR